jgi:hypothetical protein
MEVDTPPCPVRPGRLSRVVPRRDNLVRRLALRSELSAESAESWPHSCADCRDPLAWNQVDRSFGVPLCRACAKQRRTAPPVQDALELASRLTDLQTSIRQDVLTALALLEGTKFERESRVWGNQVLRALDPSGIGLPAITMSRTIARVQAPIIHSGGDW